MAEIICKFPLFVLKCLREYILRKAVLKFAELKKHLSADKLKPCYYISGDDAFVVKKAEEMFLSLTGSFRELNFSSFDNSSTQSEIISALNSLPMLAGFRIVKISDYSQSLDFIKKYLMSPSPSTVLIFAGKMSDNFNSISKLVEMVDCNKFDLPFLRSWVTRRFEVARVKAAPAAVDRLIEYCNRDMSRIENEIEKLIAYSLGKEVITEQLIDEMVAPESEFKIFELSEAIAVGDREKALEIADNLLGAATSSIMLLGMLFKHFRRLLFVALNPKSDTLASDLGVKEYSVKVSVKQASKFTVKRLKLIFDRLCDVDSMVKSGKMVDKTALLCFMCDTLRCD